MYLAKFKLFILQLSYREYMKARFSAGKPPAFVTLIAVNRTLIGR